jgi:hypothetical protein
MPQPPPDPEQRPVLLVSGERAALGPLRADLARGAARGGRDGP